MEPLGSQPPHPPTTRGDDGHRFQLEGVSWTSPAVPEPMLVRTDPRYQGEDWSPGGGGARGQPIDPFAAAMQATGAAISMPPSSREALALSPPTTPHLPIERMHAGPGTGNSIPRTQRVPRQRVRGRQQRQSFSRGDCPPPPSSNAIRTGHPLGSPSGALAANPQDLGGGRATQGPEDRSEAGAAPPTPGGNQHYPIRASIRNRALGLARVDPLLADISAVATDLTGSLEEILSAPAPDLVAGDVAPVSPVLPEGNSSALVPDISAAVSYCRGVTGIGGAMVPVKHPNYPPPEQLRAYAAAIKPPTPPSPAPSPQAASHSAPETRPTQPASAKKEAEDSHFQTSFQFVVNESTKDARNTVRKHVMREYRRRERWEQDRRRAAGELPEKEPAPPLPKRRRKSGKVSAGEASTQETQERQETQGTQETQVAQTLADMSSSSSSGGVSPSTPHPAKRHRRTDSLVASKTPPELAAVIPNFEEALAELERNKDLPYMADPWAAIAASDVDPFSRMQMELGPATRSLLHHFAWVMPSLMDEVVTGTVFNRLGWLYSAVAVHDPKPAHVILGFTLGHLAGLRGLKEPPLAIEHKNRAFELISRRMTDPVQALSDENIGAVVNVAGWELIDCNPAAFSVHMRALHQMVVERGGIQAFAHKPELQTVLVRLDAIRAYITLSQPRYPTYACFRTLPPLAIAIPPSAANYAIPPLAPVNPEYAFCEDTFSLLHSLEDTLLLLRTISKEHTGNKFPTSVKELVIATIQATLAPSRVLLSTYSRSRSRHVTRLASLVFIDAAIQHFFDGDAPDSGAKRLTARFLGQRADKAAMAAWGRSLEMVIHVLLAADRLALERPWRAWYFADALTLTMKLGHDAWAGVETMLREYLQARCSETEALVGPRSKELWSLTRVTEALEAAWESYTVRAGDE